MELAPEELARFYGPERQQRDLVALDQVPRHVQYAVLAAEDGRFYHHHGVDPRGILRALGANLKSGAVVQGGSTITQQLVKNFFLTPERTLSRKTKEALMALWVEYRHPKAAILEMYLNEIYLGQRGSVAIHGIGEGARLYFDCRVSDLSPAQGALLAGLIRGPNRYAPHRHPARALARRNQVLDAMLRRGWLPPAEQAAARQAPLTPPQVIPVHRRAPYFLDYVAAQLHHHYSPEDLNRLGLKIYTNLDLKIQLAAEEALTNGLARLEAAYPHLLVGSRLQTGPEPIYQSDGTRDNLNVSIGQSPRVGQTAELQGAVVVIQPQTGALLAMVGGRDYGRSQFNRITQARRQPGSTFKPLVYAAALPIYSPVTRLSNKLHTYKVDGHPWTPQNYDSDGPLTVTLREALAHSYNLATVDLAMAVGLPQVVETARQFGLTTALEPYPAVALGAFETIPLELARAYCVFTAHGVRPRVLPFKSVADNQGQTLQRRHVTLEQVLEPAQAFIMNSLLHSVVTEGTARGLASRGIAFPAAGKTGTTNDYRDAWFIGYTPDILALVWVGFDDGRSLGVGGSRAALPIWAEMMRALPQYHHHDRFAPPAQVIQKTVCVESGGLARTDHCPQIREEFFLPETVPEEYCDIHQPRNPLQRITKEVHNFIQTILP